MKRKNSTSRAAFTRRQFLVEGLEPRCMLAGNVNVFVSGGTLFVQGDDADNAVIIQQEGNGVYGVVGLNFTDLGLDTQGFGDGATTINGQDAGGEPVFFSGVKNDINVDLRGGNDGLGIGNNVQALNGLATDCFGIGFLPVDEGGTAVGGNDGVSQLQVAGTLSVPRNLTVNLGDGNDFTAIDANVGTTKKGGLVNINAGNGRNGVAFGNQEGDDFVGSNLLISGGNGSDNACVSGATIRGLLLVSVGGGDGEIGQVVDLTNVGAGQAQILTSGGNDAITINNAGFDRDLTITTGSGDDTVSLNNFGAGDGDGPARKQNNAGNVVIVTGDGNDEVSVTDFDVDSLTIDTGSGDDGIPQQTETEEVAALEEINAGLFVVNGGITRQLTVVTGSGNDFATIAQLQAHDIFVDTGSGNDGSADAPINISSVGVRGNVTLLTGSGNDFAYMSSDGNFHSNIGGNLTIDTGAGDDSLEVVDQTVGKDLNVNLGDGTNTAGIGAGIEGQFGDNVGTTDVRRNFNLNAGSNSDLIGLLNLSVHNDLFANLGGGDDSLTADNLNVTRNATFLGGGGSDSMSLNFTRVGGNALIDAGSGDDAVSITGSTVPNGRITVLMGTGNDTLNITGSSAKKATLDGGPGNDTLISDLGITGNGKQGSIEVRNFENFNAISELDAADDTADITEDAVPNTATGNVLDNDLGGFGPLTVTAVNGDPSQVGQVVQLDHSITVTINADGSYTAAIDNSNTDYAILNDGQTFVRSVTYTVTDGTSTQTRTLTINVHGHTDVST